MHTFNWSAVCEDSNSRHIDWLPASTASSNGTFPFCKSSALCIRVFHVSTSRSRFSAFRLFKATKLLANFCIAALFPAPAVVIPLLVAGTFGPSTPTTASDAIGPNNSASLLLSVDVPNLLVFTIAPKLGCFERRPPFCCRADGCSCCVNEALPEIDIVYLSSNPFLHWMFVPAKNTDLAYTHNTTWFSFGFSLRPFCLFDFYSLTYIPMLLQCCTFSWINLLVTFSVLVSFMLLYSHWNTRTL